MIIIDDRNYHKLVSISEDVKDQLQPVGFGKKKFCIRLAIYTNFEAQINVPQRKTQRRLPPPFGFFISYLSQYGAQNI